MKLLLLPSTVLALLLLAAAGAGRRSVYATAESSIDSNEKGNAAGDDVQECDAEGGGGEECTAAETAASDETGLPKCGPWCAEPNNNSDTTKCSIDTDIHPCSGPYHCTTTCDLWNASILNARNPSNPSTGSCANFIQLRHLPVGATLCRPECLLDEIKPNRYPAPTGLGLFCAPGTCDPPTQSRYRGTTKVEEDGLMILECPCNWFGSDCNDDWVEVLEVIRKERYGEEQIGEDGDGEEGSNALETIVFKVSEDGWHKIVADYRPGGVVRIQSPSKSAWGDRPLEQPYALAAFDTLGEIEILTAPPEVNKYHPTVTEVARRVRSLPVGPVATDAAAGLAPMYINPSLMGFFNKRYTFLKDVLAASSSSSEEQAAQPPIEHIVMVGTGAGLSGMRSAVTSLLEEEDKQSTTTTDHRRTIHIYYGLRDIRHLPYRSLLESWTQLPHVRLTLLVTSNQDMARAAPEPGISAAVKRGFEMQRRTRASLLEALTGMKNQEWGAAMPLSLTEMLTQTSGKVYVQHVLGLDLLPTSGKPSSEQGYKGSDSLSRMGATADNVAVVVCGRNELLLQIDEVLKIALCEGGEDDESKCDDLLGRRVFTNI